MVLLWMVFLRLNAGLAELASRDALTRVLNRNGLDEVVTRHFAAREPAPLALLLVDIDHFKVINDRHGHASGDAVLRAVAVALTAGLRGSDFVARVGGEEFVVGCPGLALDDAVALGERLRAAVAALDIGDGAGRPIRCTISVGVAPAATARDAFEGALRDADRALYVAKAEGRNRVVAAAMPA